MEFRVTTLRDPARLATLRETELLDSPPEERFDRLTGLTSSLLHAPVSLLTLVDDHHQFFMSEVGLEEPWSSKRKTPLSYSFCKHVVSTGAPLVINDAERNPTVQDNPAIQEMGVVAYAGFPVRVEGDYVIGDLCAIDYSPREWLPREISLLERLSAVVEDEIDQRVALLRSRRSLSTARARLEELLATSPPFRSLVEDSLAGIAAMDNEGFSYVNPRFAEIFGYTQEEMLSSMAPMQLAIERDRARVKENIDRRLRGEIETLRYTFQAERKDGQLIDVEMQGSRTELGGKPFIVGTLLDITRRRQEEDALRRQEAHFRRLTENASNIVHTVDARGLISYISPAVERVLGVTPREVVGRPSTTFVHPEDAEMAKQALAAAMAHPGTPQTVELRLRHKDGSFRTVEATGSVSHDETGAPVAVVHTQDVTQRKQAEHALQETEERYRMVIEATNSAIWDWDIASGGILWNGQSHELLRYSPGEMGSSIAWWYDHLHPEDRQPVISGLEAVLEGAGKSWSHEHRFLRGDGAYATVLNCCSVMRDKHGRAVRVIGSMMDITDRKRQVETQRFLARASTLLDESLDAEVTLTNVARLAVPELSDCCLVDLVGDGGELHRVAAAHTDPAQEKLLLDHDRVWESTSRHRHPVARVVRSRTSVLIPEMEEQTDDGQGHWTEYQQSGLSPGFRSLLIVPLIAYDRVLGAITLAATGSGRRFGPVDLHVVEDLARRAATAVEHAKLFQDAQDAIRARDEILGVVSHDLKNPLNVIQLTTSFLLEQAEDRRSDNVQKLALIQRASGQMNQMVQDLLDISSLEAGRFLLAPVDQDVTSMVAEAKALLRPIAEQKSVSFECSVEEHLTTLRIDTHRMLRVISNLVGNAIKFTPAGGTVTLTAERAGDEVRFTVVDTGPGIPAEHLSHVFDRYWQARAGDRRGAGLGLAIAKGVVEAHGGRIWAESPSGGGAVFVFTVPSIPPAENPRSSADGGAGPRGEEVSGA
jgi:PAS domain S-box-containing protein